MSILHILFVIYIYIYINYSRLIMKVIDDLVYLHISTTTPIAIIAIKVVYCLLASLRCYVKVIS